MNLEDATRVAVHDALLGDSDFTAAIGGRLYDKVPPNPTFPYMTVDIDIRGDATTCSDASEVHITLHAWSNARRTGQASGIIALAKPILAPLDIADAIEIEGVVVNAADIDDEIYRPDESNSLVEGVATFTILVDPA